jgi:ubiquinol-cytochrome c reductase cytochrome c1 subunit
MLRHALQTIIIAATLTGGIVFCSFAQDDDDATPAKPAAQAKAAPAKADTKSDKKQDAKQTQQSNATSQPQAPAQPQPDTGAMAGVAQMPGATAGSDSQAASTEAVEPKMTIWPFSGMTGYVDKPAAQRGFQVYAQVCSACHSMDLVAYRDLSKIGFTDAEIKVIASQKQVADTDDSGQNVQRPGKPSDHFAAPFPNEKASRTANNGAYPPDLSLIVKAREYGPDYVYSILTGFSNPPSSETPVANKYYNSYFQGHWISMPPPLHDGAVTYQDASPSSVDQMARDVVVFLQWAAEPEMEQRHEMGLKVLAFLFIMSVFCYLAKKRVWKNMKH